MSNDVEQKALRDDERMFVHKMVYDGLDRLEAYVDVMKVQLSDDNLRRVKARACAMLLRPHVNRYYLSLLEEIRSKETEKGVWTKELATQKLMKLIEKAEEDIYLDGKQLTMGRLNAIMLPVKELNTMNGLNTTTNINLEGAIVQISGESELKD